MEKTVKTSKTPVKKGTHGGYRPGSGNKLGSKHKEVLKQQVFIRLEPMTIAKLVFLANRAGMKKDRYVQSLVEDAYFFYSRQPKKD